MIAVFAGLAAGEMVMFQQIGFGLAVAVAIDATLVRIVVVPSTMALLGRWNWYLPAWLQWLPHVSLEEGTASDGPQSPQGPPRPPDTPGQTTDSSAATSRAAATILSCSARRSGDPGDASTPAHAPGWE
jgi:hypothetical protein